LILLFFANLQAQYNGNGNSGFGGAIGTSNLEIVEANGNINFRLTRGTSTFTDVLVFYFDSKAGGYSSTADFTDQTDMLRKAISGANGTGRSLLNFPTGSNGFYPDFALAISPSNLSAGALYELRDNSNHQLVTAVTVTPSNNAGATQYSFNLTKANLDIAGTVVAFDFLATYGNSNETGKFNRSNEGYGAGMPANNPGVSSASFTTFMSFPLVVASIPLDNFFGVVDGKSIKLKWTAQTETNLTKYILQKSNNGLNFFDIAEILPRNINGTGYTQPDGKPLNGNNFYRLVSYSSTGEIKYSKVIKVVYGNFDNSLTLFPNPTREILKINLTNAIRGKYTLEIYNDAGQKLISKSFDHYGNDRILNITLPTSMKKGPYRVYISNYFEFFKGTFIVQ
jgi:hypothetical protein